MTLVQEYFLVHQAREKLYREAALEDIDLRKLVCNALLIDHAMQDIDKREREQSLELQRMGTQKARRTS